jgi:hypothetical protein
MRRHCDADVLAEFREGLLGRRRSARIRTHLAGCARCASLFGQLAGVTALLAGTPEPVLPDELAVRLDAALAAESGHGAAADGAVPEGAVPEGGRAGRAGHGRRRGRRLAPGRAAGPPGPWRATALRAASVTAAVIVIAGGGYGVARLLQGGAGGMSAPASRPALGPLSPGAGPAPPNGGSGAGRNIGVRPGQSLVISSGTDYVPSRLAAQAEAVLALHSAGAGGRVGLGGEPASAAMSGCVRAVADRTGRFLVDRARYQGRQAIVILQGGQPGHVWVVSPSCSARSQHLIVSAPLASSG